MEGLGFSQLAVPGVVAICTAVLWWRIGRIEHEIQRFRDWKHDEVQQEFTSLKLRMGLAEQNLENLKHATGLHT